MRGTITTITGTYKMKTTGISGLKLIKKCDHMCSKSLDLMVEVECNKLIRGSEFQILGVRLK